MDEGLCGLLFVKAVPLQEKAPASQAAGGVWRSKSVSGPPVCGKGLRAALVFARVPRGGGSVPPPKSRPPRAPQPLGTSQANGLEALIRAAAPLVSFPPQPPPLPPTAEAQPQYWGGQNEQRPPLPRSEDVYVVPPKATSAAVPSASWINAGWDNQISKEVSRLPPLPPLALIPPTEDTLEDDVDDGCGSEDDIEGHDTFMGTGTVCSAIYAEEGEADTEEVLMLDEDPLEQAGRAEEESPQHDEGAESDSTSEASAEEVDDAIQVEPAAESRSEEPQCDEDMAVPQVDTIIIGTTATKKKRKKRKKKRRKSSQLQDEEHIASKKPPVPRFPHPETLAPKCDSDFLPVAATTVPITDRSPAVLNMKERLSKHLLLGRFPRRPLASLLGEGLEEGAARAVNGGTGEGGHEDAGGELTSLAAAESLGLVLESSSSSWSRPRRSQSHDGSAARVKRSREDADEAFPQGSKATSSENGRSASRRRNRARSEHRRGDHADDSLDNPLAIVGQQPKANGKKISAGSKQFLAAAAAEQRKQVQESGDAALGALYFSFSSMKDADGRKVILAKREKVVRILHELNTKVAIPICRHFGLRYNFFSEHHCQAKKAGVTVKEPLILKKQNAEGEVTEETRHLVTIRLRIRVHPSKGDPQTQFISRGTQLAVLLHELCHLKHMNHGKDFMLFLRDIFAKATKLGVFDPAETKNEIPSPWPWENEIFQKGGDVSNEELLAMYYEHKALQREKAKAAEQETARNAEQQAAAAADLGMAEPAPEEKAEAPPPVITPADIDDSEKSAHIASDAVPPPPEVVGGTSPSASQRPKAFRDPPAGALNLAAAFQKGSHAANCECCADDAGPTSMEYGEIGDVLEFETSTETLSPLPARRSRSHSRSRARSQGGDRASSISRSSSVVKLPQLHSSASSNMLPRRTNSPTSVQHTSGIPTLPPV